MLYLAIHYDMTRLRRAKDFIAAREAGISASCLQRLFRAAEGRSVFDHVRNVRLERAYAALATGEASVQEASGIAGYTSAANFATAFRRRFGIVPTAVKGTR